MPEIKIQHVVSVSSEDKQYPAENMINGTGFKKWKCAAGEKSAVVIFQFEKDSDINQIDIGNEGSAFVEILVGKAACKDDDYKVILVASSFMSPQDSRNVQNLNKVRMFTSDALSKAVIGEKWNRVKVVCTQPFNKAMQYGLSFIKFHSPGGSTSDTQVSATTAQSSTSVFRAFGLKDTTTSSTGLIRTGSLFERSKQKNETPALLTGAAAIRAASRAADASSSSAAATADPVINQSKPVKVSAASSSSSAATADPIKQSKPEKVKKRSHSISSSGSDEAPAASKRAARPDPVKPQAAATIAAASDKPSTSQKQAGPSKEEKSKPAPAKTAEKVDLGSVLKGVRFVISGIENPVRGELRDEGIEMGAVYKPDWDKRCTHLICAFENTPKYNQVKGKGRIVKKEWILDCYKQKKKLPWRKYRLGRAPSPPTSDSSDEEVASSNKKPTTGNTAGKPSANGKADVGNSGASKNDANGKTTQGNSTAGSSTSKKDDSTEADKQTSSENKAGAGKQTTADPFNDSTDSEPETMADKGKKRLAPPTSTDQTLPLKDDPFDASTDDESAVNQPVNQLVNQPVNQASTSKADLSSVSSLPNLPEFFSGKVFFFYGKFDTKQRRTLIRYITAYAGTVEEYMDKTVDYVISFEDWDENFDEALRENSGLKFCTPDWIVTCHQKQTLVPVKKYLIHPS